MLDINLEFVYGMLFIRLEGELNQNTYQKLNDCLENMIYNNGLKCFVLNMENLTFIDDRGLKEIIDKYFDIKLHDGNLVICGYSNKLKNKHNVELENVFNQIEHVSNELCAYRLLSL